MVIPDDTNIELEVDAREKKFLISLDSRIATVPIGTKIFIAKAPFTIKVCCQTINLFYRHFEANYSGEKIFEMNPLFQ